MSDQDKLEKFENLIREPACKDWEHPIYATSIDFRSAGILPASE